MSQNRKGQTAKIGNVPTRGYMSKREAERAQVLRLMEQAGAIRDLREQVRFELIPAIWQDKDGRQVALWETAGQVGRRSVFEDPVSEEDRKKKGMRCLQRRCVYNADFVYVRCDTGETVVEDAKGWRMEDARLKEKLMLWIYGIQVKEV